MRLYTRKIAYIVLLIIAAAILYFNPFGIDSVLSKQSIEQQRSDFNEITSGLDDLIQTENSTEV